MQSGRIYSASPLTSDVVPDVTRAWRWVSWFALVLTLAGFADWVLVWIPMRFGTPEWEFGTIVASTSGLPLITMGFAGLLGSAVARGIRWQIRLVSIVILVWAVCVLGSLLLFLLDVPIAIGAVSGLARVGLMKAIVKTLFLGTIFSIAYVVAGVGALRHSRLRRSSLR